MVATGRIAAAAQMDPTYSSCGVNAHPHLIHVYGSLGQRKPAPKGISNFFGRFAGPVLPLVSQFEYTPSRVAYSWS